MKPYISRVIDLGGVPLGGDYPIRVQSMTNTKTMDTKATVEQVIRMIHAGCDYVRITAQNTKEAENLKNIKDELRRQGYKTPIIADIHFKPDAAEIAATIVEKVRINPGNYIDKKNAEKLDFNDQEYAQEIDKIKEKLKPLITICKHHGTVIRIGSNHGSLSDRIVYRYGDTAMGMTESALEFLRICRELDFYNIVVSMKSSNVKLMIESTALMAKRMMEEGFNYPFHLGVTEAGIGEDGIIKSAAGLGPVLDMGIGDTIRVSLTGEPEIELPVAKLIALKYNDAKAQTRNTNFRTQCIEHREVKPYERRKTISVSKIGGPFPIAVIEDNLPENINIIRVNTKHLTLNSNLYQELKNHTDSIILLESDDSQSLENQRKFFYKILDEGIQTPVVLKRNYNNLNTSQENDALNVFQINASMDMSNLLLEGFGDAIWLTADKSVLTADEIKTTAFNILQSTGLRITKAEHISCPSCGRTNFNLEETVNKVKARTAHLTGIRIAVMGCIVNGPGEMADSHYGYVGIGMGKVTLYKGREVVKRNIEEANAIDELVSLIRENNDWVD